MSTDRRERKSKGALKGAMKVLMQQKPAEKITVTELCDRADVNRSTFYAHYGSVEQLLSDIHEDLFSDMDRFLGVDGGTLPPKRVTGQILTDVLNYMRGEEFRLFLANNATHLLERDLSRHYMEKYCGENAPLRHRYALHYHSMGCFTLIQQWIAEGCPCSSECLARQLVELSASGHPEGVGEGKCALDP